MSAPANQNGGAGSDLFSLIVSGDWELSLHLSTVPLLIVLGAVAIVWFTFRWWTGRRFPDFEIDTTELGFGDHKVSFKPNNIDRQIAYSIWVELSTRKLGLPIDLDDDVIVEIYDSWYAFFGVTRDLIKDIPVTKFRKDSTRKIVNVSIEILNSGLRPHLTKWQARFRHWYGIEVKSKPDICPQDIQKSFPEYDALSADILKVNGRLEVYRKRMYELVTGKSGTDN